jgi:NADPH:quinone reductase-like Zn-dependent oxidoreductase
MKTEAMAIEATGGPEVLQRMEIDLADPGPSEVLVRVRAVALNHLDVWTRKGLPHLKYSFPHRLGADISGEIEALGPGAKGRVGQKVVLAPGVSCGVCARCAAGEDNLCREYKILGESTQGGYARHVVVPDRNVLPYPEPLTWEDAAAIPLCFLTAWQMVVRKANVRPGQTVLVQAAGSGVSSAAIQLCKMLGAQVIATTGTPEKAERARALGADHVIDYSKEDFVKRVREITQRRGADAVIEHVGGEVFEKSILAAAWGGRVVTCGATTGFFPKVDLRQIFFRQVEVLGSTMGSRKDLFDVLELVSQKKLRPVVDRVLPLWQAAEAHRVLEERKAFGKVVLSVD